MAQNEVERHPHTTTAPPSTHTHAKKQQGALHTEKRDQRETQKGGVVYIFTNTHI